MDDKQIEKLIRGEIERTLSQNHSISDSGSFKVLGILTHLGKGLKQLFNALLELSQSGTPVLIWTVKEVDNYLQIQAQSASFPKLQVIISNKNDLGIAEFEGLERIILGAFSFELADKIIQLRDEDPIVNILIQGLLSKISVHIMTPLPLSDLSYDYNSLNRIDQEVRKRISLIADLGFEIIDEGDLKDRFLRQEPSAPDLITESFIENLRGKTREIRLPRAAIVTPLAKEKARDIDIRIIKI